MMTGLEIENFYKLDKKEYLLENNKEFLKFYKEMLEKNCCYLKIEQLQKLIDKIVLFFEFKYPDNMMIDIIHNREKNKDFYNCKEISKKLCIEELKYRLYHDYVSFLECNYPMHIELRYMRWENDTFMSSTYIKLEKDGKVEKYSLSNLKEIDVFSGLRNEESIESILEYLNNLINIPDSINYEEIEKVYENHQNRILLRNEVLKLIPLALLYSKNTLPIYGVLRAKSFIRMFNKEYNLNMDTKKIDEIMMIDYANIDFKEKIIKQLIKEENEQEYVKLEENKLSKSKKIKSLKPLSKILKKKNPN